MWYSILSIVGELFYLLVIIFWIGIIVNEEIEG